MEGGESVLSGFSHSDDVAEFAYMSIAQPNAVEWSYQDGLRLGWIPQNPTSHLSYTCS